MSRIILKISGEALKYDNDNVNEEKLEVILKTIRILKKEGHLIGIVVGGGNFFRGREHTNMNKVTADTIGMLGTVINALYIKDYLEKNNLKVTISTPFEFPNLINKYNLNEIRKRFDEGQIIIFGGGLGKSGFSTDSGIILASEVIESDLIIKMTNVDGVYNSDPKLNKEAIKFEKLTYNDVLNNNYKVMDKYAIEKAMQKNLKILVMNFSDYEKLEDYFNGYSIGTEIY